MAAPQRPRRGRALSALAVAAASMCWAAPALLSFASPTPFAGTRGQSEQRGVGASLSDAVVEDISKVLTAKPRQEAKERLAEMLRDGSLAQEVLRPEGRLSRGRLDEAIAQLEKLNPEEEPVYSGKLDGTWRVRYSGSYAPGLLSSPTRELALFLYGGGFSLGQALSSFAEGPYGQSLGVKVLSKLVSIHSGREVEALAEVEAFGRKAELSYKAELMPLSPRRFNEVLLAVTFPEPLGRREPPLEVKRSILVTYMDEEMMIVRDESGLPEVLMREPAASAEPSSAPSASTEGNATAGADPAWSSEAA